MMARKMKKVLQIILNTVVFYKNDKIEYYNQYSLKYFFKSYGKDRLGTTGCGPFVCAIVASSLLRKKIYPDEIADWAYKNGFYEYRCGSMHSLIPEYCRRVGLKCEDLGRQTERLKRKLEEKDSLGILLCKEGAFSKGRHFVVVGIQDSHFKVYNSCNVMDCYKKFDEEVIENALATERVYIGPIWYVSKESINEEENG